MERIPSRQFQGVGQHYLLGLLNSVAVLLATAPGPLRQCVRGECHCKEQYQSKNMSDFLQSKFLLIFAIYKNTNNY